MSENNIDINKITANVITSLATSTAKALFKKAGETIKDTYKKTEIELGFAYENYLNHAKTSHELIKTILYRHEPKYIYSFYECLNLGNGKRDIDTSDINNVLKEGKRIIITGSSGAGKSVMMKHFFLNSIIKSKCIPVLIELRGLNDLEIDSICLTDYIYNAMKKHSLDFEKRYFDYSLETGCYIFLFDGFDEVKKERSQKVANQIIAMSETFSNNHYIVSSRPTDRFISWNAFKELSTRPLTKKQALSLINKLEYEPLVKDRFYAELDKHLFVKYETFASNPLLLTIMLLTYERKTSIPDKLNDFYEQAFSTLFNEHDATKNYERDIGSKLGYEEFKRAFSYFCFKSFFNSDFSFSKSKVLQYIEIIKEKRIIHTDFKPEAFLDDLTNSVCVLIHDGLDYKFTHRSFQEYFAAVYTMQLEDSSQSELMKLWISKEWEPYDYLDILYELQPNRYIENVLISPVTALQKMMQEHNNSEEWLLCFLCDEVIAFGNSKAKHSLGYKVKNPYYHRILTNIINIGRRENQSISIIRSDSSGDVLIDIIIKEYGEEIFVKIQDLMAKGYKKDVLGYFTQFKQEYDFAVEFVNSKKKALSPKKNNLSSLLEEL